VVRLPHPRIIFITGTDTGVGKTLLTGLLLAHLRSNGCHALAIKPFCSGGTADIEILHALQDGELTQEEISPFYFREPLAPLVAARKDHRSITLVQVLQRIQQVLRGSRRSTLDPRPSTLLIEGSGGLLVPLGEDYTVLDLILKLDCEVIVVSRNRLGTINHTLLTVHALQTARIHPKSQISVTQRLSIVLMNDFSPRHPTPGTRSNPEILAELLAPTPLHLIPYLGRNCCRPRAIAAAAKKMKKSLAQILR
jgi:dethiobiotin synthase